MTQAAVVRLEVARLAHVHLIAAGMRPADRAEVLASDGLRPSACLRRNLQASEFARTAFVDDEALAMLGVVLAEGGEVAVPWMLTTDAVERWPMAFWRACKDGLRQMREHYPVLVQFIDARHERALSWARRLGFEQHEAVPHGFAKRPFHPFTLGVP